MRHRSAIIAFALGLAVFAAGVGQLTLWAPTEVHQAHAQEVAEAPLTVVTDGVIDPAEDTDPQQITIDAEGQYTIALGRLADVDAWVGEASHVRVTGVDAGSGGQPPAVAAEHRQGAAEVPDPADSDLWVATETAEGPLEYRWVAPDDSSAWALLIFRDGQSPAPAAVTVPVEQSTTPTWGFALLGAGALLILLAMRLLSRSSAARRAEDEHGEHGEDDEIALGDLKSEFRTESGDAEAGRQGDHPTDRLAPSQTSSSVALLAASAAILVPALVLSAGDQPQQASPDEESSPQGQDHSVLLESQLQRIVEDIGDVVAAGDEEQDTEVLAGRVSGSALEVRELAYRNHGITETMSVEPIGTELLAAAVTSESDFPRQAVVITQHADAEIPQVLVIEQDEPRENYHLVQAMMMMPGTEFPAIAAGDAGVQPIDFEEEGAAFTPAEAMLNTADLLNDPDDSSSSAVAQSPYIEDLHGYQEQVRETASDIEISYTRELIDQGAFALGLPDGSVLAIGSFAATMTLSPEADEAAIRFDDETLSELAGTRSTTAEAEVVNRESMILHIPAEDGAALVLLGVHDIVDQVTIDD